MQELPERGNIGIFNRSYYEEVLIVRVHPGLLKAENLPAEIVDKQIWKQRYRSISDLERHLHANGTRVLKFFLRVSPEEQRQRFLARLEDPDKMWKFNAGDVEERKHWKEYMDAYVWGPLGMRSCAFRIHDRPDPVKLEAVRSFIAGIGHGLSLAKGQVITPAQLTRLLNQHLSEDCAQRAYVAPQRVVFCRLVRTRNRFGETSVLVVGLPQRLGHVRGHLGCRTE